MWLKIKVKYFNLNRWKNRTEEEGVYDNFTYYGVFQKVKTKRLSFNRHDKLTGEFFFFFFNGFRV
jgi:hypothetical protein